MFKDDYSLYYMFYATTTFGKQPDKFPAGNHPAQYKAILTKAQQQELDGINRYRKKAGAEPLVFDPEMAAFANYRSWMNQEKNILDTSGSTFPATMTSSICISTQLPQTLLVRIHWKRLC